MSNIWSAPCPVKSMGQIYEIGVTQGCSLLRGKGVEVFCLEFDSGIISFFSQKNFLKFLICEVRNVAHTLVKKNSSTHMVKHVTSVS